MRAMRPGLEIVSELSVEAASGAMQRLVSESGGKLSGGLLGPHIQITVGRGERHFWSPFLIGDLYAEGAGSRLIGRFSPDPAIWTMWAAGYGILLCSSFFALVYGGARLMLGASAWVLLVIPIAMLLAMVLYWGSMVGQTLGAEQMRLLQERSVRALDGRVMRSPVEAGGETLSARPTF